MNLKTLKDLLAVIVFGNTASPVVLKIQKDKESFPGSASKDVRNLWIKSVDYALITFTK